jgi:hypothetical protein
MWSHCLFQVACVIKKKTQKNQGQLAKFAERAFDAASLSACVKLNLYTYTN